jgi:2-polyprenyl-6-methoxyphenol hydroxylase-like FAD-dependent oxidoreductase
VILEQDPNPVRSSHQAGIACGPATEEILRKYDATGLQCYTPSVASRAAYRKNPNFKEIKAFRHLTSWGLLYRVLRANFDGLASEAVPNPPPAREGDGRAEYRAGQRVTDLRCEDGCVTVTFVGQDGAEGSLTADLVIAADGMHSTVRGLVKAPVVQKPEYSGYVAWRGTVPESDLPPETAAYFASHTTLNLLKNTYIVR